MMFEESRLEFMIRWYLYRRRNNKHHRRMEYEFYKLMDATSPGIFVDLGANFGTVTAKALEYGHKVYAFEPDPFAFRKLHECVGSNPNAVIVPKAVGASKRTATFFRRPDVETGHFSKISSLIPHDQHHGGVEVEVEVVDIVDFLRALPQPPSVIKMDIEGAEAECLEAILDAGLHRSIGMMLVETHECFSPEIADRLDRIRARIAAEAICNINLEWI
ncbi:MAG: FkbM family methyltransferase [Pseudomonadota bacterium]|nr:FkbM family methyltransferase [Pseudomonadota bacterium]